MKAKWALLLLLAILMGSAVLSQAPPNETPVQIPNYRGTGRPTICPGSNGGTRTTKTSFQATIEGGKPGVPVLGGLVSPDGTEEMQCPLPASEKKHNTGGRDGSGLCVFTSIEYAARWANERTLFDLQAQMKQEPGGGWPEKVDAMLAKYAPGVEYLQSTTGDLALLRSALASGRQAGVTYSGYDPHYRSGVNHMVALVHLTERWAAVSDNNYPGDNETVWMSPDEFSKRHKGNGGGWSVVLLHCGPPPIPKGGK